MPPLSVPPSGPPAPAPRPLRQAAVPLIGLLFSVVFLIGFAQFIATGGLRGLGPWMVGLVTAGALLAEQAWVNGDRWGGLRGMLIWGGMAWLLAVDRTIPWAGMLILVWYALQPRWFGRRP